LTFRPLQIDSEPMDPAKIQFERFGQGRSYDWNNLGRHCTLNEQRTMSQSSVSCLLS
jgi:hypothetical protein